MKKIGKSKKAVVKRAKLGVVNVKMTEAWHDRLVKIARRHADGNLSAWLRHAGSRYTPKKGEKIKLEVV